MERIADVASPAAHLTADRSVARLDRAFDRVSALDFEIPNPFVNHAPMACEALDALDLGSTLDAWVERSEASMHEAVAPVPPDGRWAGDWTELVGDHQLLPEWMGYFDLAIRDEGWSTVVGRWVPRFMPGLASALFHGAIRTSHAVRAIEGADTESRRAELARALGNWAVWQTAGEPVHEWTKAVDPARHVLSSAARGALAYVDQPNIVRLHGVTGAMAVHLLSDHVTPSDADAAAAQLEAEHRALFRGRTPASADPGSGWDERTVTVAAASLDPHQIKLVEACRRGFRLTADPGFSRAAAVVTSVDR